MTAKIFERGRALLAAVLILFGLGFAYESRAEGADVETRAVVTALFEAFNRHDLEGMAALYAEDAVLISPDYPEPLRGPDAVRESYKVLFDYLPDVRDDVTRVVVEGDQAAVEFTSSWQQPTAENPDARKSLQLATFFKIKDGLIVEDVTYFDRKAAEGED